MKPGARDNLSNAGDMELKSTSAGLCLNFKHGILNARKLTKQHAKSLALLFAAAMVALLWQVSPAAPLDKRGIHFLATLSAGVALWIINVFDEYVVALLLLVSWLFLKLAPAKIAVSGFSDESWFFVLGALGMGAAVSKCGLLNRFASQLLSKARNNQRLLSYLLAGIGVLMTPLLPRIMARIMVVAPIAKAASDRLGAKDRSNASASLALSAFAGCTVLTFMFMTAGTYCLVGWSLLPASARSEFGWGTWTLAALPAGIFTILFVLAAINFLFPKTKLDRAEAEPTVAILPSAGPLSREESLCMVTLGCTFLGWLTKPIHGISEPSIALAALLLFSLTGVLDRNSFKNNVEWGFLVFFGVAFSLASIATHLKIDVWLMNLIHPVLSAVSFHPAVFLVFVLLLVYVLRLFILPTPAVMLILISLTPWAQNIGIHPGVLLLTILMGAEVWFMSYQHIGYALAYGYANGAAFSHPQGRKLMLVKLIVSVLGLLISIPYWRFLGFIR